MDKQKRRECPSCHNGTLNVKTGKYGVFFGCTQYPNCRYTKSLGSEDKWVSATDISSTEFCPQSFYLKRGGARVSAEAERRMADGEIAHARVSSDKRCYIATYAFGSDHYIVESLRVWRDSVLKTSWYGRGIIHGYYQISPLIIRIFGRSLLFRQLSRVIVKCIAKWVGAVS